MINDSIKDMMRRDTHFREQMRNLGYNDQPVVAVADWQTEVLYTSQTSYPFAQLDVDYLTLLRQTRLKENRRTLLTENAIAASKELVEHAPKIPSEPIQGVTSREIFQNIFMYEMLLMNMIEDELELTEDEKLELVEENGLTHGVDFVAHSLIPKYQRPRGF